MKIDVSKGGLHVSRTQTAARCNNETASEFWRMHDIHISCIQTWQVQLIVKVAAMSVVVYRKRKQQIWMYCLHTLIDTTHDTLSRLPFLLHHVFIQIKFVSTVSWFLRNCESINTTYCRKLTVKGTLTGCALQSMEHSQERIQDLDFPACGQLEKLGVALFIIGNPLQSLMILFSAISMAMSISGTLCVLVLDALW